MNKKTSNTFSKLSEQLGKKPQNPTKSTLAIALHSSRVIKKVTTVWTHIYQSQPFSGAEANVCRPIHFQNRQLTIECDSPTLLNHLRFNQSSLIKQLHKYGFNDIDSLRLTIKHKSNQTSFPENITQTKQSVTKQNAETASKNSLNMIAACAKTSNTSKLSNSLNNLIRSLENLKTKKN